MAGTSRDESRPTASSTAKDTERRRLAEALRANLERRKKQKSARRDHEASAEDR